jgi:hypothetical protein
MADLIYLSQKKIVLVELIKLIFQTIKFKIRIKYKTRRKFIKKNIKSYKQRLTNKNKKIIN